LRWKSGVALRLPHALQDASARLRQSFFAKATEGKQERNLKFQISNRLKCNYLNFLTGFTVYDLRDGVWKTAFYIAFY
jgi:hypothetical protein